MSLPAFKYWDVLLIAVGAALSRTILSMRNRSWDSLVANVISAGFVTPVAFIFAKHFINDRSICAAIAGSAALVGVDVLKGILKLGETFMADPESVIGFFWTKGKK